MFMTPQFISMMSLCLSFGRPVLHDHLAQSAGAAKYTDCISAEEKTIQFSISQQS